MSAPTPGPWEAHQGILPDQPTVWDVTAKHGWTGPWDNTPEGWFVATVHEVSGPESAEANARLIAAAPDLLEALRDIVEHEQFNSIVRWERARAAIAKAGRAA